MILTIMDRLFFQDRSFYAASNFPLQLREGRYWCDMFSTFTGYPRTFFFSSLVLIGFVCSLTLDFSVPCVY